MRIVFYDPDCPELIFPASSMAKKFFADLQSSQTDETKYCFIPMKACDLNKDLVEIAKSINGDLNKIGSGGHLSLKDLQQLEPEYFLLGVYPQNKNDESEIAKFFDDNVNKISLWIDTHDWSPGLILYLRGKPNSMFLNSKKTYLEQLKELGYPCKRKWLNQESAMLNFDVTNLETFRYMRLILTSVLTKNLNKPKRAYDFLTFGFLIKEIAFEESVPFLADLLQTYNQNLRATEKAKKRIKDTHPLFKELKKIGRPVGYLFINEENDNINIDELLNYGKKIFPWLIILEAPTDNPWVSNFYFDSDRIPIRDIIKSYGDTTNDKIVVLKLISAEIARYQEKTITQ